MSALTQDRVKTALQEVLAAQPGKKDSKWTGSDEAAAMGGVIEFLQNYMENDGKIEVEGKEKLKGQAARLALRLENAAGGAQKISESAARVFVAAQCVWNAHRRREGRDHN